MLETFLSESKAEQSSSEISEALGLNRGRVRILYTLSRAAMCRIPTKRYRLGMAFISKLWRDFDLPRIAGPALADLTAITGGTSYVFALNG